jgi:hypothetical protein
MRLRRARTSGTHPIRKPVQRENFGVCRARSALLHLSQSHIKVFPSSLSTTRPASMASTIPSTFRRGEKKSATGANNLRTVKAAFASSPQLPQIRKSGESIAAKKSAIELRINLVNKSEYNFEDREQHFLPFASASRFWVLTSPCPELVFLRFVARGSCCAAAFRFMVSRNRVVRASSRTDSRMSRVLCGGLSTHLCWLLLPPPLSPLALPSSRAVSPYEGSS